MAKILSIFSLRTVIILSLALNVDLIFDRTGKIRNYNGLIFSPQNQKTPPATHNDPNRVLSLARGDPIMYEKFWQEAGDKATVVIPGWQFMSYFSDVTNICWFLEQDFAKEVRRVHKLVGNAVVDNRHIVVGTGSTQLFQAALYALASRYSSKTISVVAAKPFYSSYPLITDCVNSTLHKWAGDAQAFDKDGPYIELITTPNNPDGFIRSPVVNKSKGILVHDFAYYWPQYTPITAPADHEIMLFTASKSTGHGGMRIGWAIVKDEEVAKKMTKYIELNTIGVSKDSQLRASKVLKVVSDSCEGSLNGGVGCFFKFGFDTMQKRWKQLREVVNNNQAFSLPKYPLAACQFLHREFETQPGFAWVKCEEVEDCESLFKSHGIHTRGGKQFGVSTNFVRISMLDHEKTFDLFIKRLSSINQ